MKSRKCTKFHWHRQFRLLVNSMIFTQEEKWLWRWEDGRTFFVLTLLFSFIEIKEYEIGNRSCKIILPLLFFIPLHFCWRVRHDLSQGIDEDLFLKNNVHMIVAAVLLFVRANVSCLCSISNCTICKISSLPLCLFSCSKDTSVSFRTIFRYTQDGTDVDK